MLGKISAGLSYIMNLNINNGVQINTGAGLLGVNIMFWFSELPGDGRQRARAASCGIVPSRAAWGLCRYHAVRVDHELRAAPLSKSL